MSGNLKLANINADIFIPDKISFLKAASRTTHMAIGAHQDDIELLAFHGIDACFKQKNLWFTGVTVTDGRGSPRSGIYADYKDNEMAVVRRDEQCKAAVVGEYSMQVQLGYTSDAVKSHSTKLVKDLELLLRQNQPEILYLHSIFDFHATHIAVVSAAIEALKKIPLNQRPKQVFGVEIWGSLDWLPDIAKIVLNTSGREYLLTALLGVYDSQIGGGKRYDQAQLGRLKANATFANHTEVDQLTGCQYAVNLLPLIENDGPTLKEYIDYLVLRFKQQVIERLNEYGY